MTAIGNVTTEVVKNEIYPAAHIDLPFQAGVKGTVLETQVRSTKTEVYTFYLDLHFREGDDQDRNRASKLAGQSARDTGLPIPIHLSVGRIGDAEANGRSSMACSLAMTLRDGAPMISPRSSRVPVSIPGSIA